MEPAMTDDQWAREVLAILAGPLRDLGMDEPMVSPRYIMWHCDGASPARPCADSPVWQLSGPGCYDIIVQEDGTGEGTRLGVHTEGTMLLDCPAPSTREALADALRPVAAQVAEVVRQDIRRFETENHGHLPGTGPNG